MEFGKRIQFEKLINTRDLGGFPARGGRTVRGGLLIRSGQLCLASEGDKEKLAKKYRLRRIIDFRTRAEQAQKPDPQIGEAKYFSNPILEEEALGITREGETAGGDWLDAVARIAAVIQDSPSDYMQRMYENLALDAHARARYGRFLKLLASGGEGASLWHCTAGKDRAGVGAAILLSVLGVSRDLIAQDYLMTNEYYREQNEAMAAKIAERTGDRSTAGSAVSLYSAKESYIRSVFSAIDGRYGGDEAYFRDGLGLGADEADRLRALYLE